MATEQKTSDNHNQGPRGIYIDIDSFLDTRLSLLESVDVRLAVLALKGDYNTRKEEIFPHVSKDMFLKLWNARDSRILRTALPTRIKALLSEILADVEVHNAKGFDGVPQVYLNTWPYRMSREEARGYAKGLSLLAPGQIDVHTVRWAPPDLLPAYVKDNIAVMVAYDYQHWLNHHAQDNGWGKIQIPNVTLFVPELMFGKPPSAEDEARMAKKNHTVFSSHEFIAKPIIGIKHLPVSAYNADIDAKTLRAMRQAA